MPCFLILIPSNNRSWCNTCKPVGVSITIWQQMDVFAYAAWRPTRRARLLRGSRGGATGTLLTLPRALPPTFISLRPAISRISRAQTKLDGASDRLGSLHLFVSAPPSSLIHRVTVTFSWHADGGLPIAVRSFLGRKHGCSGPTS